MTDVKVKVTFIIPKYCKDENDCSEDMLIAFTACENHRGGGLQAHWIHEHAFTLDKPPAKSDIFVLSEFEGELYEKLKATKCLLVGPRCLSCSLTEGNTIPSKGHPVYTVAMRGLIVTISGLTKELKASLKQKIEWMGGTYSAVLCSETTHLIASNVFSDKYIKAVERGIPVMRDTWIDAVWAASLHQDISGASPDFNPHRLPPFANLQITTSGLSAQDKKTVMKLVNAHGGEFSRVFLSQATDVLVLTKDTTGSEKYKAALEFGKVCVTPHWVKDSAALGFALPVSRYRVSSATTSSPVKDRPVPDMSRFGHGDCSAPLLSLVCPHVADVANLINKRTRTLRASLNLTRITRDGKPSNFVDESKMAESIMLSGSTKLQDPKKDPKMDEIQREFEAFDVSCIKKAGPIFDGFCIWVSGLEGVAKERAWACVSRAGGVRYEGPHARVTHAVSCGTAATAAAAALPGCPLLSPLWLLRSVRAGHVLDEADFLLNPAPATPRKASQPAVAAASPMSKRTLQMLQMPKRNTTDTSEPQTDHIVDHYLSQNLSQAVEPVEHKTPEPEQNEPARSEDDTAITVSEFSQTENIFKGLVFEVQGLEDEAISELGAEVRAAGGVLAAAGAGGSHALVPLDFHTRQLVNGDVEAVTVFWVKDCLSRQELTPIEYYHRPVGVACAALQAVVASLSTYTGVERAFLDELAKLCGATMQQRFCRRSNNSALASTHLICPEASGAKYTAARKWGVPVVRASWLLDCATAGRMLDEAPYLVDAPETDQPPKPDNTLTNPEPETPKINRSKTPEAQPVEETTKRSKTPVPDRSTPEPKVKTVAGKDDGNLPVQKDDENLPVQEDDVNLVGDVEPNAPDSPRQAKKKFKKINNKNELFEGMSPASRFIAMRRMGMFSDHEDSSKENTPRKPADDSDASLQEAARLIQTPPLEEVLSSPNLQGFSPNTRRKLQAVRRGEMPDEPVKTPVNPFDKNIKTPDSDFGAALRPGTKRMSVDARKLLWEFVNELPTRSPQRRVSDAETPPSKIAKLTENQSAGGATVPERKPETPPSIVPAEVDEQLQRLNVVLTGRRTPRRASRQIDRPVQNEKPDMEYESGPESQPNTVGWDDTTPSQKDSFESSSKLQRVDTIPKLDKPDQKVPEVSEQRNQDIVAVEASKMEASELKAKEICTQTDVSTVKRFMLSSNVDNREETVEMILRLGGEVTDLDEEGAPPASHLLCCAPARSQRVLNCIAAGCWVLHPAYVARSAAAGGFLPEESFEWGNPAARCLPPVSGAESVLARAAHRWRSRRHARGAGGAGGARGSGAGGSGGREGPFSGLRALLHAPAPRRALLARLVRAGGGDVVDEQPPYTDESINVCFADPKRYPMKERDRAWLVSRGVPVCPSILLSAFLTEENRPDLNQHCIPEFKA